MTHLPYIIAAYGITLGSLGILWTASSIKLKATRKKLSQLKQTRS